MNSTQPPITIHTLISIIAGQFEQLRISTIPIAIGRIIERPVIPNDVLATQLLALSAALNVTVAAAQIVALTINRAGQNVSG